ncbi:hypothetical protein DM01DRAFT_1073861 [Hesseltinella vesiculosa]|uniref:Uncharacterized protein n=1 Tax=Hesseltinella vesiculosa TaxID=101127 RepID=A0A1X2GVW9_9FUNG|nr:hypothetical protein DM01DRAFT_1073861 [Hesseltinella vesiculosa]
MPNSTNRGRANYMLPHDQQQQHRPLTIVGHALSKKNKGVPIDIPKPTSSSDRFFHPHYQNLADRPSRMSPKFAPHSQAPKSNALGKSRTRPVYTHQHRSRPPASSKEAIEKFMSIKTLATTTSTAWASSSAQNSTAFDGQDDDITIIGGKPFTTQPASNAIQAPEYVDSDDVYYQASLTRPGRQLTIQLSRNPTHERPPQHRPTMSTRRFSKTDDNTKLTSSHPPPSTSLFPRPPTPGKTPSRLPPATASQPFSIIDDSDEDPVQLTSHPTAPPLRAAAPSPPLPLSPSQPQPPSIVRSRSPSIDFSEPDTQPSLIIPARKRPYTSISPTKNRSPPVHFETVSPRRNPPRAATSKRKDTLPKESEWISLDDDPPIDPCLPGASNDSPLHIHHPQDVVEDASDTSRDM